MGVKIKQSSLILGVDPGSIKTGYALICAEGKKKEIVKTGVFRFEKEKSFFKRLALIKAAFDSLAKEHKNFDLALEALVHVKNVNSLSKLAQARGVIIASLMQVANGIFEYSPNLVKSSVSGYGLSSKDSVQKSLNFLYPKYEFETDDESDALAVALCHSLHQANGINLEQSSKRKSSRSLRSAFKHLG